LVELTVENSNIKAVNDGLPPTTTRDKFTSAVPIEAGGVYLVGAFEVQERKRDTSLGFRRLNAWENETRIYQVWLRAYQVNGGAIDDRSQSEGGGEPAVFGDTNLAPGGLSFTTYDPPAPTDDENEIWEAPNTGFEP